MSTQGFELVYLETHKWGKRVAFWQALGLGCRRSRRLTLAADRGVGPHLLRADRAEEAGRDRPRTRHRRGDEGDR
jgi:hypothetical protein